MKLLASAMILVFLASGTLAQSAFADPPRPAAGAGGGQHAPPHPGKPGKRAPGKLKKKILKKFDTDGDGKLSPAEKEKAKEWRKAHKEKKRNPPV